MKDIGMNNAKRQHLMELNTRLGVESLNRTIKSIGVVLDFATDDSPPAVKGHLQDAIRDVVRARQKMNMILEHNSYAKRDGQE